MQPARGATASLLLSRASRLGALLCQGAAWAQVPSGPVTTQPTLSQLGVGVSCSSSRPKASQKGLSHLQSWVSRQDDSGSEAWELIPTGLSWVPTNGEVGVRKTTLIIWGEHHSVPFEVREPNPFSLLQL